MARKKKVLNSDWVELDLPKTRNLSVKGEVNECAGLEFVLDRHGNFPKVRLCFIKKDQNGKEIGRAYIEMLHEGSVVRLKFASGFSFSKGVLLEELTKHLTTPCGQIQRLPERSVKVKAPLTEVLCDIPDKEKD